jgi:hypothetical protein
VSLAFGEKLLRNPTTGIAGSRELSVSGHATVAPPNADMNFRLAILIAVGPSGAEWNAFGNTKAEYAL